VKGGEIDFAFNRRLISIPFERLLRIPHPDRHRGRAVEITGASARR
jgi:hypothetical protein